FYYLRVVKFMYFDPPADVAPLQAGLDMRFLLGVNGAAIALFGIFPDALVSLCTYTLLRSL
ncbi:MAG: NADH:ubiquinone oxidoreductase subunit N, partial [Rhodocyclaceae bacterium]